MRLEYKAIQIIHPVAVIIAYYLKEMRPWFLGITSFKCESLHR
jgi:hypothetical protein